MNFDLKKAVDILQRTPSVLDALLKDISNDWALNNEGKDTFSPFDVVGHLIQGEKTDWVPRMEIILSNTADKAFQPYDRFAQVEESKGKTMNQLLAEFRMLRQQNMNVLESKNLTEPDFAKLGTHPKFGPVTLQQLLATWTVHDLSHIAQITRVMCKQYKQGVGPWVEYLPVLTRH
ncbi:MAG TPA: DinB family protein [Bacteroidia bacterium]|nr:DinB family protein [Bacteroidia bacterium]